MNRKNGVNNSNKIKYLKMIIITLVIIILSFLIILINHENVVPKQNMSTEVKFDTTKYKDIKEFLNSYEIKFIKMDKSKFPNKIYVKFPKDLYEKDKSNQKYFESVIYSLEKYNNFQTVDLIDESREIFIKITTKNATITDININGSSNYFIEEDSKINKRKEPIKVTQMNVESELLNSLISNSWNESNIKFGSKESRCNKYEIFFDEGYKYKNIGKNVYNIIFTEQFKSTVVNGLTPLSTKEEIIEVFGAPTFESSQIYGYVNKDFYIFFAFGNKEISIYPLVEIKKEEEVKLKEIIDQMNKDGDIKALSMSVIDMWKDFDVYDYDANNMNLKYTLKGIEFSFSNNSLENGIFIYDNYMGNSDITNKENVYMKKENLIWEEENARVINDQMLRVEQGSELEELNKNYGKNFALRIEGINNPQKHEYSKIVMYSRDKSYPDTELEPNLVITSYKWFDENRLLYSVDDEGIYLYDCSQRFGQKLLELSGRTFINEVDGKLVKYNDTKEFILED